MLYGWAKGAEAMHLPAGVGFRVGQGTGSTHLVLQVCLPISAPSMDTLHRSCFASLAEQNVAVCVSSSSVFCVLPAYDCMHPAAEVNRADLHAV